MKGYKAYKKGLICDPYGGIRTEYKEGEIYAIEGRPMCCHNGIHFCKNPMDLFNYYPLVDKEGNMTEFTEIEALGETDTGGDKSCTNKIKIGFKLELKGLINAAVNFIFEKANKNGGDYSQLASSGYGSQLASSGDYSQLASSISRR